MNRRTFFHWILGTSASAAVVSLFSAITFLRRGQREVRAAVVAAGDRLVHALGPLAGQPLSFDGLGVGEGALAFPEGKEGNHDNLLWIVKLDPAGLREPTRLDWTDRGVVAYSAICTHLGCTVRLEEPMGIAPFTHFHCPCHAGFFDPYRGAQVISGPPPRPLPQLPVKIGERGEIVVVGGFSDLVGVKA